MLKKKNKHKYQGLKQRAMKILKKVERYSNYFSSKTSELCKIVTNSNSTHQINIRITPNNVFCTLKNINTHKIIIKRSAGKYKLNVSKKNLKFLHKIILQNFLDEILKYYTFNNLIIIINCPIKIKKLIIKQLKIVTNTTKLLIKINPVKVFNGCRQKKKKRNKQKGLRVYK